MNSLEPLRQVGGRFVKIHLMVLDYRTQGIFRKSGDRGSTYYPYL